MLFEYNGRRFCGSLDTLLGDVSVYLGGLQLIRTKVDNFGADKYSLGEESIIMDAVGGVENASLRALLTGEVLKRLVKEYKYHKETGDDFWDWSS
jgi:hypothetical protein